MTEEEINTTFLSLIHSMHNLIDIFQVINIDPGEREMPSEDYEGETEEEYQHRVDFANERHYAVKRAAELHDALVELYNEDWNEVRDYINL